MAALNRNLAAAVATVLVVALQPGTGSQGGHGRIRRHHTTCSYQRFGGAGRSVIDSGISEDYVQYIVDVHNHLRNRMVSGGEDRGRPGLQPAAADMNALEWDEELAGVAQRCADRCTFHHDSCREDGRFEVGQKLYSASTTGAIGGPQWGTAIARWYSELIDFSTHHVNRYQRNKTTGHYTQLGWRHMRCVGCGYTAYTEPNGWKTQLHICYYRPASNIRGGRAYTAGRRCSSCRSGCHRTYSSLCAHLATDARCHRIYTSLCT